MNLKRQECPSHDRLAWFAISIVGSSTSLMLAARRFQRETSGDAKTLERHCGFLQRNVFANRFNISCKNCSPGDADPPTKLQHPWATLEHLDTRLLHPSRARRGSCRPPSIHLRCEHRSHDRIRRQHRVADRLRSRRQGDGPLLRCRTLVNLPPSPLICLSSSDQAPALSFTHLATVGSPPRLSGEWHRRIRASLCLRSRSE